MILDELKDLPIIESPIKQDRIKLYPIHDYAMISIDSQDLKIYAVSGLEKIGKSYSLILSQNFKEGNSNTTSRHLQLDGVFNFIRSHHVYIVKPKFIDLEKITEYLSLIK